MLGLDGMCEKCKYRVENVVVLLDEHQVLVFPYDVKNNSAIGARSFFAAEIDEFAKSQPTEFDVLEFYAAYVCKLPLDVRYGRVVSCGKKVENRLVLA